MAEAVAIRTFMKLKVLEAIPEVGSISLQDLSKATGAQDSLLGLLESQPDFETRKMTDIATERMARILGEIMFIM